MENKVIDQKHYPKLEIDFAEHDHIQIWMRAKQEVDLVLIENETRTEVAKAICPKYQQVEDERDGLKEQHKNDILLAQQAVKQISELEDRNAKLLEALKKIQNWLYNGNDEFDSDQAMDLVDNIIQQSETKSKQG